MYVSYLDAINIYDTNDPLSVDQNVDDIFSQSAASEIINGAVNVSVLTRHACVKFSYSIFRNK